MTQLLRRLAVSLCLLELGTFGLVAEKIQVPEDRRFGDNPTLEQKIKTIMEGGADGKSSPRSTLLLEHEINSFLRFQTDSNLPDGIADPTVTIGGSGRVKIEGTVALDLINEEQSRDLTDPLRYLVGSLQVAISGTFWSGRGIAKVDIEEVTVAGVPVSTQIFLELVGYFMRTSGNSKEIQLDQPFELPYPISEIRLSPGQAIVVQ